MKHLSIILIFILYSCGNSKEVIEQDVVDGDTLEAVNPLPIKKPFIEVIKDIVEIRQQERTERVKERQETKRAKETRKTENVAVRNKEETKQVEAKEERKTQNVKTRRETKLDKVITRQENKGKANGNWWIILAIVIVISGTIVYLKIKE